MYGRSKAHLHFSLRFLSLLVVVSLSTSFFSYLTVRTLLSQNLRSVQEANLQQIRAVLVASVERGDGAFVQSYLSYLGAGGGQISDSSVYVAPEAEFLSRFPSLSNQAEAVEVLETGDVNSMRQSQGAFSLTQSTGFKADLPPGAGFPQGRTFVFFSRTRSDQAQTILSLAFLIPLAVGAILFFAFVAGQARMKSVLASSLEATKKALAAVGQGPFNRSFFAQTDEALTPFLKILESHHQNLWTSLSEARRQGHELEIVLDSMGEGILILDTRTVVQRINQVAAKLFSLDRDEAPGKQMLELIRSESLYSLAEAALSGKGPQLGDLKLYREKILDLLVSASPIHDDSARIRGAVLVLSDITTLKNLEEVRKEFVANVSHELRTPITVMKGFAETLMELGEDDEETRNKFLAILHKNAQRLEAIIDDLLTLSRLEQNGGNLGTEEVAFKDVFTNVLEVCGPSAEKKGTRIVTDFEAGTFRANRNLLEQALLNLVDNAVKYCPPGSTIEIRAEKGEKEVLFSVSDNGPGIPLKDQEHIFERFYRVDKTRSRNSGGTGLGLSIVKHIALVHGGSVGLESVPSKGTRFLLRFPREPFK